LLESFINKVRTWFSGGLMPDKCLQCGLPPKREFMVAGDNPIMHPHECSWCKGVLYVPGPMFQCKACSENGIREPAA
jgi:hypothetical protein